MGSARYVSVVALVLVAVLAAAGVAFDPCYHSSCDDIDNLSTEALDQMSDATAHALLTFTQTTSSVNGTVKGSVTPSTSFEYKGSHQQR